jgi:hypothetical protein
MATRIKGRLGLVLTASSSQLLRFKYFYAGAEAPNGLRDKGASSAAQIRPV